MNQENPLTEPERPINLSINKQEDLDILFNFALNNWSSIFDANTFRVLIEEVGMQKNISALSSETRDKLKEIRKAGLILKSAIRWTNITIDSPKEFDIFIKTLGLLNDAIYDSNIEVIHGLIIKINSFNLNFDFPYSHISIEVFQERFLWICIRIEQKLSSDKGLALDDVHKIRIWFRHIMNLFQLCCLTESVPSGICEDFCLLKKLNKRIGQLLEAYQVSERNGQTIHEGQLYVSDSVRVDMICLLNKFREALNKQE